MTTPVAVFCYNRPHYLRLCLEHIEYSQSMLGKRLPLYIFCDAPSPGEEQKVEQVIQVAKAHKGAQVVIREKNFGFRNVVDGISELCATYGKAIVVEDDVIVAPDFLPFLQTSLEKYQEEEKVFMISGFMFFNTHSLKAKTFFLPNAFIWGWGTWERAWKHFSWEPEGWEKILKERKKRLCFDHLGSYRFSRILKKTMEGECDAWDPQWLAKMFLEGGLALHPYRSLAWNCGVGCGVHGRGKEEDPLKREFYMHGTLSIEDFKKPRLPLEVSQGKCFPKNIALNQKARHILAITFLKEWNRQQVEKRWRRCMRRRWKMCYHYLKALFCKEG